MRHIKDDTWLATNSACRERAEKLPRKMFRANSLRILINAMYSKTHCKQLLHGVHISDSTYSWALKRFLYPYFEGAMYARLLMKEILHHRIVTILPQFLGCWYILVYKAIQDVHHQHYNVFTVWIPSPLASGVGNIPKRFMYWCDIYLSLKGVPMSLLGGLYLYHRDTWTLWERKLTCSPANQTSLSLPNSNEFCQTFAVPLGGPKYPTIMTQHYAIMALYPLQVEIGLKEALFGPHFGIRAV